MQGIARRGDKNVRGSKGPSHRILRKVRRSARASSARARALSRTHSLTDRRETAAACNVRFAAGVNRKSNFSVRGVRVAIVTPSKEDSTNGTDLPDKVKITIQPFTGAHHAPSFSADLPAKSHSQVNRNGTENSRQEWIWWIFQSFHSDTTNLSRPEMPGDFSLSKGIVSSTLPPLSRLGSSGWLSAP